MKKGLLTVFGFLLILGAIQAQTEGLQTVHGNVSSCGMAGNSSFAIGQVFFQQLVGDEGLELSEGIMQAQQVRRNIVLNDCQNAPEISPATLQANYGFFRDLTSPMLAAGLYDSTSLNAAHYDRTQFNYDSLTTLHLEVWPIFESWDTLHIDSSNLATTLPLGLHGGDNRYVYHTADHGCDSLVHYYVQLCGGLVADADGNLYESRFVGPYCWTQRNMQTTHYNDGSDAVSHVYVSYDHPEASENLAVYGRLYSWYSAVGLPENSTESPAVTSNGGFVTGVCPQGWHIPTAQNLQSLLAFGSLALRSTNLWLVPGDNSSGINLLPAGYYNALRDRYENLLGETALWSSQSYPAEHTSLRAYLNGYCEELMLEKYDSNYGFSVRCVKNNLFDEDGNELNF